ncbi:hypothetical protein ABBQ38_014004 [Trebouxia sp. C0009 RCD-2024]
MDRGPQPLPLPPQNATSRQGSGAMALRPVSARTYMRSYEEPAPAGPIPLQSFKSYKNDLFGEEDGDVLAAETIPAAKPIEITIARPTTPSNRVQQQIALNQQKRLARLQGGLAAQPSGNAWGQPGSPGSRPGTAGSLRGNEAPPSPRKLAAFQQTSLNKANSGALSEIIPLGSSQGSPLAQSQVLDLAPGPSNAEQSLMARGLSSVYDPNLEAEAQTAKPPGVDARAVMALSATPVETLDNRAFLMLAGSREAAVQCCIVRDKSSKLYPKYRLLVEAGTHFLMSARKRKKSKSSNYILSFDEEDTARFSANFAGKVRANFLGTEFTVYDQGQKPREAEGPAVRCELAGVRYEYNVLGTRGPRKMTALIPGADAHGQNYIFRPETVNDGILDRQRQAIGLEQMVVMANKAPRWNEQLGAYCLNFNGRVTHASVKNFQLVTESDPEYVILQFGKVGKDKFTMDYRHPMNAFQAFAICLSSFDHKLGCE